MWVKVVRAKYGWGNDTIPKVAQKRGASNLWKGVCSAWEHINPNISWRTGNGNLIRFWLDKWVPLEDTLVKYFDVGSYDMDVNCTVKDFILHSGQWDAAKLSSCLPVDVVSKILAMHIPACSDIIDRVIWHLSHDGRFTLKSAYNMHIDDQPPYHNNLFKIIWKWKGPQRVKTFLWLVAHAALLTNKNRVIRHIAQSDLCQACGRYAETVLHTLRDCDRVKMIWSLLVDQKHWNDFQSWN